MTWSVKTLRVSVLPALTGLLLLVAPAAGSTDGSPNRVISSRAALERSIVAEINSLRADRGLRPLAVSSSLRSSARSHARDMARVGFFGHTSANGTPFAERIRRFYRPQGYRYWRAGENLLWASPEVEPKQALRLWLKSPAHRKIMLSPDWREIGLSAVHTASAPRIFEGLEVTIVTANFGARLR